MRKFSKSVKFDLLLVILYWLFDVKRASIDGNISIASERCSHISTIKFQHPLNILCLLTFYRTVPPLFYCCFFFFCSYRHRPKSKVKIEKNTDNRLNSQCVCVCCVSVYTILYTFAIHSNEVKSFHTMTLRRYSENMCE